MNQSKGLAQPQLLLSALALASATGCSAAPNPSPRANPAPASSVPIADKPDEERNDAIASASATSFEQKHSGRFNLAIPLPDAANFKIDDTTERWFVATHASTNTTLLVRTWREDEIGGRARCEDRARSWRALPEREGSRLVEAHHIEIPPEHDTTAEVRIRPRTKTNPAEGFILAFGGWAHRCFAYVFITRDADEKTLADRLATMTTGSLARIQVESELAPSRIPHEKPRPEEPQSR